MLSTSGKWLVITTKKQNEQARHDIDNLINNTLFLPIIERPCRSNRYNINNTLVSYADALQKESTPREQQYNHAPKHAFKRNVNVSYNIEDERVFPTLNNKKIRTIETPANDLVFHATLTTASLSNDDYTIHSSFSHDEFLKQMEEKNNKLRSEIETSYNQEIKKQLRIYNTTLMSTIDQHFSAFRTVII